MHQKIINTADSKIVLTWIDVLDRSEMNRFQPCTQVYAVCFNTHNDILVIDDSGQGLWKIPGGTPEAGETPEQTLARELLEEADVALAEMLPIGVQRVEAFFPNKNHPNVYHQWRFTGRIVKILSQTPDPATGNIHARKFIPLNKVNDVVNWGDPGKAMFRAAIAFLDQMTNLTPSTGVKSPRIPET